MLPQDFDAAHHLPRELQEFRWEANYLVHAIAYQVVFHHRDLASGANLKAAYLETPLARKLPALREALRKAGVVWCDYEKIEGEKCYSYGLRSPYCDLPLVWVENQSERLSNAVRKQREAARSSLTLRVHKDLAQRLSWFDFDHEGATAYIDTLSLTDGQKSCYRAVIDCIRDKDFQPWDCPYGRFHSAITRMPSCLRRFLSFEGRRLSCIDLKNSQPFILNCVVASYYSNNRKLTDLSVNFHRSSRSHGCFDSLLSQNPLLPPASPSLPSQDGFKYRDHNDLKGLAKLPDDALKYLEITTTGRLYETLSGLGQCEGEDRNEIKVALFKDYLYAKRHKGRINDIMRDSFPSIDKVVRHFKTKDYKFLPKLMQKYESSLFINRIARHFIAAYPDRAIGTIHDSLIVETSLVPQARAVVEENFGRIGLHPRLSQDDYDTPRGTSRGMAA